jgi:hypothetical protein
MDFTISEVRIELGLEKKSDIKNTFKIRINKMSNDPPTSSSSEKEEKKKIVIVKTKDVMTGEIVTKVKKNSDDSKVKDDSKMKDKSKVKKKIVLLKK